MCGIFGIVGVEDRSLLRKMANILEHRGPDERGFHLDKDIGIGNVRLKIIDLTTGKQPIYNEDSSIVVVYNGEIYNFKELRGELEKRGHRFSTNTDTEVIVHAYEEWGYDCVNRFNGMFAFALWDTENRKLFIARDRIGIKPLYYAIIDNQFIFASEIKAILLHPDYKRMLDLQAFHYFVNLRYAPKEYTLFKDIKKLLPAHYLVVRLKKGSIMVERKTYWNPKIKPINMSEEYFSSKLLEILKKAVKRHLVSDVPLGVYLSSGIDSSTIVAIASQVSDESVKTFTMVFGDPNDEHREARALAERFETDHTEISIEANGLLKEYPKMIWYADMPKRNLYPYYLSKAVKKYVKVILTGLGGDELFGGYDWKYQFAKDIEEVRKNLTPELCSQAIENCRMLMGIISSYGSLDDVELMNKLKKYCFLNSNVDLYLAISSLDEVFLEDYLKTRIYGEKVPKNLKPVKGVFAEYFKEGRFLDQILLADYSVKMVDDFLHVDDTMSMANSIESRVPFLDAELVDFAFKVPSHLKFNGRTTKYILKRALKDILPKDVLEREKRGFGVDVFLRFRSEIREYAEQLLPEGNLVKIGLIKKDYIERVIRHYPQPEMAKHYTLLWNLLTFELWYEIFIKSDRIERPNLDIDSYIG